MDKRADKMKATQVKRLPLMLKHQSASAIETTLYELMETVIDVASPDEDRLVNEETLNLLAKANLRVSILLR
jgi:hypothetical protein